MDVTNKQETLAPRALTAEAPAATPAPHERKALSKAQRVMLTMSGLVAATALGLYLHGIGRQSTDDAFVDGHIVNVSARTEGQVTKLLVTDNQVVAAGDPLLTLDDTELTARLAAAAADLAAANAQVAAALAQLAITEKNTAGTLQQAKGALTQATSGLSGSEAALEQAKADVTSSKSRFNLADIEFKRVKKLRNDGVVSVAEVDQRQSTFDQAKAALAQAEGRLHSAQTGIQGAGGGIEAAEGRLASANTAPVQVQAAQAAVDLAKARVAQSDAAKHLAEVNLSYATVRAPVKGLVSRRTVEVGHVVMPGTPLLALVPLDDVWVVANFKEDQIADMAPGQPAFVQVDTFGRHDFRGKVDSLAAATGSKFALLPPDNATGNFVKVVQRFPVLIRLEPGAALTLRPGMSASVTVVNK